MIVGFQIIDFKVEEMKIDMENSEDTKMKIENVKIDIENSEFEN